ncbi:hypothetical protein [Flavobacterium aquidurense]|uniref:Choline dehydrogenase-like flavoprotein n=1 Tax=Flavobacterium aquidurense TaxID=362413 RepID=A0A0Q0WAG3_9FLAO|nr:hypothetical protein [Flavobacterium aquidurense]KQB43360.1 Choline dehydrogenase-like flavoprotein [Flavobacterium aquidurense]
MKDLSSPSTACVDPISESQYPVLESFTGSQPILPQYWECTCLLHPFSPVQSNSTDADKASPFFEICIATVYYAAGIGLNALLVGSSGRRWWYNITPSQTTVSTDGINFVPVDMGWTVPGTNWFGNESGNATCAGTSYLNWMEAQQVNWWKIPVGSSTPAPATWMWFDSVSNLPVRLMFGQGPVASPIMGDVNQLALFQMFSFSYFSSFQGLSGNPLSSPLIDPVIDGFSFGNPNNYELFEWNTNFGMTVFMTPVNEQFNPLPTRVLYNWAADDQYKVSSDRSQSTLMKNTYNKIGPNDPFTSQVALLTGPSPLGMTPPPNSRAGFIINYSGDEITKCLGFANFPFPQEAPNWVQIPAVGGSVQATILNNPVLCPNNPVTVLGVLFPPSGNNYPDSTYLWTWYSPLNASGSSSRPVTFMQSQSGVGLGTSLALADYFDYEEFTTPIPPCNFAVPPADFEVAAKPAANTPENPNPSYPWLDTGIRINASTVASISYLKGLWTANPNDNYGQLYNANGNPTYINAKPGYTMPNENEGALIGKVGDTVFLIGMGATTPVGLVGKLELCINDDLTGEYGAGLADNIGSITVQITVGF